MIKINNGKFVISLDLELFWGVLDKFTVEEYGDNVLNVSYVVEEILKLFTKYDIHATWGVVGCILFEKSEFLEKNILKKVNYINSKLSAYNYLELIKNSEESLFFNKEVVNKIRKNKNQEIGTHTFSHYFVSEPGQTFEDFEEEIKETIKVNEKNDIILKSIIFPKNQNNEEYNGILKKYGIKYYRGNEKNFLYRRGKIEKESFFIRGIRLLDSYINIGGNYTYNINEIFDEGLYNVRASRFLRPYCSKIPFFNNLKINRIKKQMRYAAENKEIFHLWWHPHNFGKNIEKNMKNLEIILQYYEHLKNEKNFESVNMAEIGEEYESFNFRKER